MVLFNRKCAWYILLFSRYRPVWHFGSHSELIFSFESHAILEGYPPGNIKYLVGRPNSEGNEKKNTSPGRRTNEMKLISEIKLIYYVVGGEGERESAPACSTAKRVGAHPCPAMCVRAVHADVLVQFFSLF